MPVDLNAVFQNMLSAASGPLKAAGPKAQSYLTQIMNNHKQILMQLAQAKLQNQISDADLQTQLDSEKQALAAELLGLDVIAKEAAQSAANAAISVLITALKAAV